MAIEFTPTIEVAEGNLLLVGGSYYYVADVREPMSGLFPGLSFYGYWWLESRKHWSPTPRYVPAPYDRGWRVVSEWSELFPTTPGAVT